MVWVTAPTPSVLSEWVQALEREPSMELALVREAVLERANRVILAEGTGREGREAYSSRLGLSQIRNKWIDYRCWREDVGGSCQRGGLNPFLQGRQKENARRQ